MVVHRGASWDASPDTPHRSTLQTLNNSHRSSLQTINQNSLTSTDSDASRCKRIISEDQAVFFQSVSNLGLTVTVLKPTIWLGLDLMYIAA